MQTEKEEALLHSNVVYSRLYSQLHIEYILAITTVMGSYTQHAYEHCLLRQSTVARSCLSLTCMCTHSYDTYVIYAQTCIRM